MKCRAVWVVASIIVMVWSSPAQETGRVLHLPRPDTSGGKPLMQALKERRSSRSFSTHALPEQVLSNLLWAAFGINRPDGHRTAPSARNWQEMSIYAVMEGGAYLYHAETHSLTLVAGGDLRAKTGTQSFVTRAPLDLVYVADLTRVEARTEEDRGFYTGADCGFIAQNVYLYCASEGLAVVVRASVDKPALAAALGLTENHRIVLSQTVGYPEQ